MSSANPKELLRAILACAEAGARVLNLSEALSRPSSMDEGRLKGALNYAASRGVIVVTAAGNQGKVGSPTIISHSWVIPVACCDLLGKAN